MRMRKFTRCCHTAYSTLGRTSLEAERPHQQIFSAKPDLLNLSGRASDLRSCKLSDLLLVVEKKKKQWNEIEPILILAVTALL